MNDKTEQNSERAADEPQLERGDHAAQQSSAPVWGAFTYGDGTKVVLPNGPDFTQGQE